jgi:type IV secretion system protein VirD4
MPDPPDTEPSGRSEYTLALVAVTGGAMATFVWLGGQVGALLANGRWPSASSPVDVALAAVRNPRDLRGGWPPTQRLLLPATPVMVALAALLGAVAVMLVIVTARTIRTITSPGRAWRSPFSGSGRRGDPGESRSGWAAGKALRSLEVSRVEQGRLTLGRRVDGWGRNRLLAAEERASVVVLGPTQSGKTSGLAVPAILEWEGPVVATSVKTDLVAHTLDWRQRVGKAWVYDPTASTGLAAATWSPLVSCGDWDGARRTAAWLCSATRGRDAGTGDDDFWYATAAKLLAPHLLVAARAGRDMGDVVRWIDTQEEDEVAGLLELAQVPEASAAMTASWGRDERTRSSVYTTAETVLEAFGDRTVARSTMSSDIDVGELLGGPSSTLYVCAPGHEQARLKPLFSALLHHVFVAAYDRTASTGRPLDPPLLVVLDEAANIAPLGDLDTVASTAAGHGIQLITVWQDLAQIQARYGPRAGTVVNNHRAKIVLSGISDPPTLDYASRLLGETDIGEASVTTDRRGGHSTTRANRERRLLTEAELRRIQPQHGVLVYGHLEPVRLRLRPWFADPTLLRRGSGSVATDSPSDTARPARWRPQRGVPLRLRRRSSR